MNQPQNLHILKASSVPELADAIENGLVALDAHKAKRSDETGRAYNAAWFALGAAWAGRYPDASNEAGAFESFRRILIASEMEE